MNAPPHQAPPHRLSGVLENPQVRVALLTAVALLVEVVLAKNVLDVSLNFFSMLAPFWVFTVYQVTGRRDRMSAIVASIAVVSATAAVLLVYAL
jgi:hypothetical protein